MDIDPNALIILVIMVVGGLKWLAEALKNKQEQEQDQGDPEPTFADLYEEARQEIQERQGRQPPPVESEAQYEQYADPNIFRPLTVPPVLQGAPATTPPPLPGATAPARRTKTLSAAEQAALERIQEHGMGTRARRRRSSPSKVRKLLASPAAARDAIVLREIIGSPKGQA